MKNFAILILVLAFFGCNKTEDTLTQPILPTRVTEQHEQTPPEPDPVPEETRFCVGEEATDNCGYHVVTVTERKTGYEQQFLITYVAHQPAMASINRDNWYLPGKR